MEKIFSWTFSNKKNRWQLWYIIAASIVLWFVLWWILSGLYIMSFVIILVTWLYIYTENNSDDNIEITISSLWIKINNNFYDYSKIESFALIYNKDYAEFLRLNLNIKWIKLLELKIDNEIAQELKEILINYIPENENSEYTAMDKIIKLLKL